MKEVICLERSVCLLIHGFGGDSKEISYLQNYLSEKNINTCIADLPGHGKTKRELSKSSPKEWVSYLENKINELKTSNEKIILIGFSMGGLLCTNFLQVKEIYKIVLINTPIYFWNMKVVVRDIFSDIKKRNYEHIKYYRNSVFGTSLKSGIDFLRVLKSAKNRFKDIKMPALVLQCKEDESVRYKSAKYIANQIGSQADLILYDGGCHQIFQKALDIREKACGDIYIFLISK